MTKNREEIKKEWSHLVNMTPPELKHWLGTPESQSVGDTGGEGESTGHKSGGKIIEILGTKEADRSDDQWQHMGKVTGYIKRHKTQGGPLKNKDTSPWRYSLMNWGHDPLK